jgi:hypothetical protein
MKSPTFAAVFLCAAAGTAAAQQLAPSRAGATNKPDPNVKASAQTMPGAKAETAGPRTLGPGNANLCGAPTIIAGPGVFPFDNTAATTDGPLSCNSGNTDDVWFRWTATATGSTGINTCGQTALDTVIAVYNTAGCPIAADLIACNDDGCAPQSTLNFGATNGNTYMIQVGGWSGANGTGTFTVTAPAAPPANDDCSAATALVGLGAFPTTNAGGTTGAQGQAEAICFFFGSSAIINDVWHTWVAPSSGLTVVSLCPGPGTIVDSKLAVYNGAGCPTGAAISCNDDTCGLISEVSFTAVMGQSYTFQLGNYGGTPQGTPGSATLTITQPPPPPLGEGCANPFLIAGFGTFPFDNTLATTETQFGCGMEQDFWYLWNAPTTGTICIDTCGQTGVDTKLAAYNGPGCPGTALACSDDNCGFQTVISVGVTAGQDYLIQLGSFPGAGGGPGTFTISPPVAYSGCRLDDGTTEDAVGGNLGNGSGVLWMHAFGNAGDSTVISSVSSAYGTAAFPGGAPPNGTPVLAGIWNDPTNDGDPTDAVLLATAPGTVQNVDTDILNQIDFSPPVVTSGVYFVGVGLQITSSPQFMAPLDTTCVSSNGRAWIVGQTNGTAVNYGNLAANGIPPIDEDGILPGVWLLRADCSAKNSVTPFCFGDGTGFPCPCGNNGGPGRGCENSSATGGGLLSATGNASVGTDTLVITASGLRPTALGVLFQSTAADTGHAFGDGVSCLSGTLKRLYKKSAVGGTIVMPSGLDPSVSAASAAKGDPLSAGSLRNLGLAYRDPLNFCNPPPATFNGTNMLRVVWGP